MQDNAYFELDEEILFLNYRNLEKTLNKYWPNFKVGYSYKTNSLPWLINWMKSKGAFAEVVSTPEYKLAKKIGYSDSKGGAAVAMMRIHNSLLKQKIDSHVLVAEKLLDEQNIHSFNENFFDQKISEFKIKLMRQKKYIFKQADKCLLLNDNKG